MMDRAASRDALIAQAGWQDATLTPLAGDASSRRYFRLKRPTGASAILMDSPPAKAENTEAFLTIGKYLTDQGLSAPRILGTDLAAGYVLLEDLGDALFARLMAQDSATQTPLYNAAVDVLVHLHKQTPPAGLPRYADVMPDLATLPYDWYLLDPAPDGKSALRDAMAAHLARLTAPEVIILRDYHAENLIWLPDRDGLARVGLLDFQDAMLGHPAYDLISLTTDARRDVAPAQREAMLTRYVDATGADMAAFQREAAVLSVQRNLRILGVFARLCRRDGKAHYVDLIPRVWDNLMGDLGHSALDDLRQIVMRDLPPPTPDHLQKLKELIS